MNPFEMMSLAKVIERYFFGNQSVSISEAEYGAVLELFKRMSDYYRQDWSPEQRGFFKALVDFAKEDMKRHHYG